MRIRDFVSQLEAAGDLATVDHEVSPEAVPLMIKAEEEGRNRAIRFAKIGGHDMPLVANLYGSYARYGRAVGAGEEEMIAHIQHAIANPAPAALGDDTPCFEVVHEDPDITSLLPMIKYHPLDGGPYITSAIVFMKDPDSGRRNISFIRFMVMGPRQLGFNPKSVHNKAYYEKIALAGRRMEVAFCLGAPTEMAAAAAQWIPDDRDEVEVAMAMGDAQHLNELAMAKCRTVDIEVPAGSEIVVEGVVSTDLEAEGPFGDWTGTYARPRMNPTLEVTSVSHRRDAVYQTILPGDSMEQIILTIVRFQPEIDDLARRFTEIGRVAVPFYGLGRLAIVSAGQSGRIEELTRAFLAVQSINRVIVVNEDVDVDNAEDVLWALTNRIHAPEKVIAEACEDEWLNNLKLGIDTTVDLEDIRYQRTTLKPFQGRR